jgi:hypothetical protein
MKCTRNLPKSINLEIDTLRQKQNAVSVIDLSYKFNTSRTSIGRILSLRAKEKGDIKRRVKYNINTNTVVYWEFV